MTRWSLQSLALVLWLAPFALCEEPTNFTITKQRKADTITVLQERGVTVFAVSSSNGIGWAKIENRKAWPMKAIVRLAYADGREWKHLEQFSIVCRHATISTQLRGGAEVRLMDDQAADEFRSLSREEVTARYGIEISQGEKTIDLLLPMNVLAAEDGFTIRWVDLFRN